MLEHAAGSPVVGGSGDTEAWRGRGRGRARAAGVRGLLGAVGAHLPPMLGFGARALLKDGGLTSR